ncbi:MAG: valine--tRNA ligase [Bacteroidota bacterium]
MEISTKYTPGDIEDKWYKKWEEANIFASTPDDRPAYTVVIPPPNVTGMLHMGHILDNTLQDVLIRRKRMEGFNALWVPGTDHASIATEAKVVKKLAKRNLAKEDIGREAFLKEAYAWKEEYGGIILHQLRKLGASCDWTRTDFTMGEAYSEEVIQVFCDLFEKGLIYRGIRMVNWDPAAQTAVSDEEVNHKDTPGHLYHIRYPIEGMEGEYVTIATTRPETILADTAIAIHPEDDRYQHLHGKKALIPLINRAIPIILDDYVDREFGTGCLKVTPAHDVNDYEIGLRHQLPVIDVLNPDGTIAEAGQLYIGLDRFRVRKQISKDLNAAGLLADKENYTHSVGYSERTDAAIEPRLSMQWFLKMEQLAKPALEAVEQGDVTLIPGKFINTYRHWMTNIRDWCLSRQLWWGHQIPAYYIQGGHDFVVAATKEEALEKAKATTNNPSLRLEDLKQDPDVLDTWASSWLWPISVFRGILSPDNEDFQYYYPTDTLVTGPDILFFWVARMIIAGYEYTGKRPFKNVYLHGLIRDKKGKKMSKSLGNSPNPLDLIDKYGADGTRVGIMLPSPAGNDLIFDTPLNIAAEDLDSKYCEQGRNFANKIWNAFRLIRGWETSDIPSSELDMLALEWMRERINAAKLEIDDHFQKFRLSDALMSVYKLKWDEYCSWFLEAIKPEYGSPISATTLQGAIELFEETMQLIHPFMPFITEEIWQGLQDRSEGAFINLTQLIPGEQKDAAILKEFSLMQDVITAVRAFRNEKGISFKESIQLYIKTEEEDLFSTYQALLKKFLLTESIEFVQEKVEQTGSLRIGTHEIFIPLASVDVEAEKEKIRKEIVYIEGFIQKTQKKLSNERFINNAPAAVVDKERKKLSDGEAKLAILQQSLQELEE